jgi:hypothetical protein
MGAESLHVSPQIEAQMDRIGTLGRLLGVIGVCVLALQPVIALAAPTPSPSLDGVLAAPPATDFSELPATTQGVFAGPFDAKGYVTISGTPDPTNDQKTMEHDGFLTGFGKTWVQRSKNHVLVEAVLAFNGGDGATRWMRQAEAADKALPSYKSALTISGVPGYYGAHLFEASSGLYSDGFVVVKGNDAFLVVFASRKDDLANTAQTQAKKQFDSAPDATIPKSQWPETNVSNAISSGALRLGTSVVTAIVVLLIVIVVARFLMRSRRRPMLQAVPMQGGYVAAPEPVPAAAVQMSDDRGSWWDGATWRNAEHEAPPGAQRSTDGQFWWDGVAWRPIRSTPPA